MGDARAFRFETDAGPYWTVLDDAYEVISPADSYLRYVVFSRGRTEGTSRTYAESLALYFTWASRRSINWDDPDMTSFQMWLRVTPSPWDQRTSRRTHAGPGGKPVRSDAVIDRISLVVCEMMKHLASQRTVDSEVLGKLYEIAHVPNLPGRARARSAGMPVLLRRRHTLSKRRRTRDAASVDAVKHLLAACGNVRDVFLVLLLVTGGLRRGEALGLRREDMHVLPDSTALGCAIKGPHLHVVPRDNPNSARAKSGRRWVPVTSEVVEVYGFYRQVRQAILGADNSDFVFVNLFKTHLGEPMKLHAVNELFKRLGAKTQMAVTPHMLRHTFGTETIAVAGVDVVKELMGHAHITTTAGYLHPPQERLRDAVNRSSLGSILQGDAG